MRRYLTNGTGCLETGYPGLRAKLEPEQKTRAAKTRNKGICTRVSTAPSGNRPRCQSHQSRISKEARAQVSGCRHTCRRRLRVKLESGEKISKWNALSRSTQSLSLAQPPGRGFAGKYDVFLKHATDTNDLRKNGDKI